MEPEDVLLSPILMFVLSTISVSVILWFFNTILFHGSPITLLMTSIGSGLGVAIVVYLLR